MPFHIDYRPADFDQVIGNKQTILSLKALLTSDCPHAILFVGPTGCGKTTIARIVKKHLGCSDEDFIEINTGNNRGIDTAREIMSNMRFAPANGQTRVFLLDEVHRTTNDFQGSMLKPLEDCPSHVYFLLCTTDPTKLLPALKNRCSIFTVSKLSPNEMFLLIRRVIKNLKVDVTNEMIRKIVNASAGCPRQALVLLQQIVGVDADNVKELSLVEDKEQKQVIDLCRSLLKKEPWKKVAIIIDGLGDQDLERVRRAVLGYMSVVLLKGDNPQAANVIMAFKEPFFYCDKPGLILACYSCCV